MKILIVLSGNVNKFTPQLHHAFVHEQIESIKKEFDITYDIYPIRGKGFIGYLINILGLRKKIKSFNPDIVHAHYGLSGVLAILQRIKPVVITFHGSDINSDNIRPLSAFASRCSKFNIFVSDKIQKKIKVNSKSMVIPCGINLNKFYPVDMKIAREKLNMDFKKRYILFNSGFDRAIKNPSLAFSAVEKLKQNCELIELKDKSREQVNLLLNACDLLLLTSHSEGSPQIIKEAMACNCPIVATDVGDIKEVINETEGCYITTFNPNDITEKINLVLNFNGRTNGRKKIEHFDNKLIAEKIYSIYKKAI